MKPYVQEVPAKEVTQTDQSSLQITDFSGMDSSLNKTPFRSNENVSPFSPDKKSNKEKGTNLLDSVRR